MYSKSPDPLLPRKGLAARDYISIEANTSIPTEGCDTNTLRICAKTVPPLSPANFVPRWQVAGDLPELVPG